jgi:pentatricopeptide repeat protein
MLDSYGKAGLLDKLEDVLERMKKAGCCQDLSTYNILINIYGRNNQLNKMADIFQEMQVSVFKSVFLLLYCFFWHWHYADIIVTLLGLD